ncbi:30S ribosomal protein S20 [Victivallis sp. Marseille-Q1083]|uniref:30S ribosomal protein S20 n=1 Tax=Victivallis sp. Marseille-Q1083 TaxID=2717288 RepID=UPI00158C5DC6|nr:30S ribosomal protein S20 [Victivallis sp. Marseille-Q1083]
MPHLKSAIKRLRTSKLANQRNKARTSALKTFEKKFRAAVSSGDAAQAAELLKMCCSKLDKAAKVGVIHRNKVANKKSQLDKLMNSLQAN